MKQEKYPWEGDPQAPQARAEELIRKFSEAPDPIELPSASEDVRQLLRGGNRSELKKEVGALESEVEGPVGASIDLERLAQNPFIATHPSWRPTGPL